MKYLSILSLLMLGACSVAHPVHGVVDNGVEFLGTANSHVFTGDGDIHMVTDDGRNCTGHYEWQNSNGVGSSSGTFSCDGGMSGTFAATGTAQSEIGFGKTTDGHKIKFYVGDAAMVTVVK